MKIGILSSLFSTTSLVSKLSEDTKRLVFACYKKFGKNNTFMLNPFNFQINFLKNRIEVEYYVDNRNIFPELDVIFIRKTRGCAKEIYDLIRVFKQLKTKPLILDPIESFNDPLSKISSFLLRLENNFNQPDTSIIWLNQKNIQIKMDFPLVLKPVYGYKGHCVKEVLHKSQVISNVENCLKNEDIKKNEIGHAFLLQRKIDVEIEYRVLVLNGQSLGCVEKYNDALVKNADQGGEFVVAKNSEQVEKLAINVTLAQKLFFAGVDIVKDKKGNLYILECNRNPQFVAFQEAYLRESCNIDIAKTVIDEIYKLASKEKKIKKHDVNNEYDIFISYTKEDLTFAFDLLKKLNRYGLRVWLDNEKVSLTDDGVEKSLLNLEKTKLAVVLISKNILHIDKDRIFYKELEKIKEIEENKNNKFAIFVLYQNITEKELKKHNTIFEYFLNNRIYVVGEDQEKITDKILKEFINKLKKG